MKFILFVIPFIFTASVDSTDCINKLILSTENKINEIVNKYLEPFNIAVTAFNYFYDRELAEYQSELDFKSSPEYLAFKKKEVELKLQEHVQNFEAEYTKNINNLTEEFEKCIEQFNHVINRLQQTEEFFRQTNTLSEQDDIQAFNTFCTSNQLKFEKIKQNVFAQIEDGKGKYINDIFMIKNAKYAELQKKKEDLFKK